MHKSRVKKKQKKCDLYSHDTLAMEHWHEAIEIMNVGWHVDKEGKLVIHPIICDLIIGPSTIIIPSLVGHLFWFFFWFPMFKKFKIFKGKCQTLNHNFEMCENHISTKQVFSSLLSGYHLWLSWIYAFYLVCVSSMVVLYVTYCIYNPKIN
jgi:hypothetical protein